MNVLEWPSQSLIKNLYHDLNIDVHCRYPSSQTELEQLCQNELKNFKIQMCKCDRDISEKTAMGVCVGGGCRILIQSTVQ